MEYGAQKNAWMDEEQMLQWVKKVWKPSVARFEISYLLLDCCTSHLTTSVKEAFDDCNTRLDFIPKGYTCKLQAMDVGINKPLKIYITRQFDEWLIVNKNKKPKRQDAASWIWIGWSEISETIVRNAWRGCGIDINSFIQEKKLECNGRRTCCE
jgi:DDE superfamily endonuclease